MQHHFVVFYDDETKTWEVDFESTMARFSEGNVWADKTDGWFEWNLETDKASDKLHDIFLDANEENN